MNNTLSTKTLYSLLSSWSSFHESAIKIADDDSLEPIEVSGLKGSLSSFFVKQIIERLKVNKIHITQYTATNADSQGKMPSTDFVVIVPTQKEADEIQTDFETAFDACEVEIHQLPWWGMLAYRPAAKGSSVFGERAGVLAKLSTRSSSSLNNIVPRIFIITERSLLTPVPPPSYTRKLTFSLRKGQQFDPEQIVSKLTDEGYIRVPRVGMKGELALRGEVLDIFMPDEDLATRIVFDFDKIEQIKTFDVATQSTKESLDFITVYPMKEVVWTEELAEKLETILSKEDKGGIVNNFADYDEKKRTGTLNSNQSLAKQVLEEETYDLSLGKKSKNKQTNNRSLDKIQENDETNERSLDKSQEDNTTHDRSLNKSIENDVTNDRSLDSKNNSNIHLALTDDARNEKERILTELEVNHESEGEELFYGILWDKQYSVLDYIAQNTYIFCYDYDRLCNAQRLLENEYNGSYRIARQTLPVLTPDFMLFNFKKTLSSNGKSILFRTLEDDTEKLDAKQDSTENKQGSLENISKDKNHLYIQCEAPQSYFGNINYLKEQMSSLQNDGWQIFVFADNVNQALRIEEILKSFTAPEDKDLTPLRISGQAISQGFSIADEKILVVQENEIFGRKRQIPKSIRKAKSAVIDNFVELNPGDYVVHVNYGIGLFKGIERVKSLGTERDYIKLEYADEEFAFVPIEQVNMVQRYIGSETEKPHLDRIGSKSWSARKAKVQKTVEELAEKLIDLYSKRKASRGYSFPKDTEWQSAFEAAFPYEDTPDQVTVTQEIKEDMEKDVPMDRLVCGDVGYGKTEIAMRAAFKAVMGGKQVAFLAPTTILAEQHYETCMERFKNFPVHIAEMSRFVPPAKQKIIKEKLKAGGVDILIGTHKILQKDIVFKDLGLLIIDEEQRFGVKDKEKLKVMKTNIDCLAMSATPIPRTL
ncbi:MAG: DEAD/DEAH box helicase, partial [Treponema sp.]